MCMTNDNSMFDDFDTEIQCEDFNDFVPTDDDYEDFVPEEEDDLLHDPDDDLLMDEEDLWFTDDGGLTADAYQWLAQQDKENGFC